MKITVYHLGKGTNAIFGIFESKLEKNSVSVRENSVSSNNYLKFLVKHFVFVFFNCSIKQ